MTVTHEERVQVACLVRKTARRFLVFNREILHQVIELYLDDNLDENGQLDLDPQRMIQAFEKVVGPRSTPPDDWLEMAYEDRQTCALVEGFS